MPERLTTPAKVETTNSRLFTSPSDRVEHTLSWILSKRTPAVLQPSNRLVLSRQRREIAFATCSCAARGSSAAAPCWAPRPGTRPLGLARRRELEPTQRGSECANHAAHGPRGTPR